MKTCSTLLLILAACCSMSAHADVITLGAAKDTMIVQANPTNSDGAGAALFSGADANNSKHRALISFDLSSIPAGATITNVQLTLTLGQIASGGLTTATIGLYDITHDWGQGSAGKSTLLGGPSAGIAGSGGGFAGTTGDATWSSAFLNQTSWTTAGGDYSATPSASLTLGNTLNVASTWLSTPQLVADLQGWLSNPSTNFGWELVNANEGTSKSIYGFYSSDWHTFPGGNTSYEPALQVTYAAPEPATGSLAAIAALALLSLRPLRRRA